MSTAECGSELDLAHERPGTVSGLALVMLRASSAWRALRNRFAASSLHDLDDRQLNDIGLTRRDVVMAFDRSGVLDDPSLLLASAARQRARTRFARPASR